MFDRPAKAYDRHVGRYSAELGRALMDFAGVAPGASALDVGCGPGGLTAQLAARLGADRVAGVEPSESFAAAARQRLPGVRIELASADALPFEDDRFDFALAQLVLNFLPDPERGVREMARTVRSGGVVAAAAWDYAGEMILLRAFWDAAAAVDAEAGAHDEGRTMRFGKEGELAEVLQAAGLDEVRHGAATVSASYDDFEDLWGPLEVGIGPSGRYLASLAPDGRERLKAELRRALGAGDAPFELTARAWLAGGTVA